MRGVTLRRWILIIAFWLPFPCLFLPFTYLKEPYHPWYIDYTFPFVWDAIILNYPANLLAVGLPMRFGYEGSMSLMHAAAFMQSAMLSYIILRTVRKPPPLPDAPP